MRKILDEVDAPVSILIMSLLNKSSSFSCLLGFASAAVTQTAESSVVYTLSNTTFTGFNFNQVLAPGSFEGTLTSVSVNATLTASTNYTYADDLCIYINLPPLGTGGLLQVGGFSNLAATTKYTWANGNSDDVGTTLIDTVTLATPITFGANSGFTLWIGNGYGAAGNAGTWTGTVTLNGITAVTSSVPEPGNLLGLSGLIAAAAFSRGRRGGFERKPTSSAKV